MTVRGFSWHVGASRVLCSFWLLVALSCDRGHEPAAAVGTGVRVASLSPGVTATIVALGAEARLVGRTPWCETTGSAAVVGTLLDLDAEALVRSLPTVIVVQPPAQGVDPSLAQLAQAHGWVMVPVRIDSLADVRALIPRLCEAIVDQSIDGDREALAARAAALDARFNEALAPLPEVQQAGRVLVILATNESADPMAFGVGTYLGDFVQSIGATNALSDAGYPALSVEELVRSGADTLVVLGSQGDEAAAQLRAAMPKAFVCTLRSQSLVQPGAGMIDGLLQLRAKIASASAYHVQAKRSPNP